MEEQGHKFLSRGFTLIEVLVVIFIIGLMSGATLVSYRSGNTQYILTQAVQVLAANVRQAQNKTLSGQQQGQADSPYGFGINVISATQYIIFFNPSGITANDYVAGSSQTIETVTLPVGVTVAATNQRIFYVPPDPTTYLNGAGGAGSITLTLSAGSASRNLIVYSNGKIEIN